MPTFGWFPEMQLALNSAHPLFRKILGQGGNFLIVLWTQVFLSLKVYVEKMYTLYIHANHRQEPSDWDGSYHKPEPIVSSYMTLLRSLYSTIVR